MRCDLTIIIVNYNTQDWVENCLRSLERHHIHDSVFRTEVVVVDNGSSDNSAAIIKKHFPWVELIETGKNLGFAGGNNIALQKVKSKYVMLLNSDAEFTPKTKLDAVIEYLDNHLEVAVVTPKVLLPGGDFDLASHRGEPTLWASVTYFTQLEKLFPKSPVFAQYHQSYKNFAEVHEIEACSGAAMVVRTSAIEKVGYLDEQFFMYAEDLDWCKRFRDAQYKIMYLPFSVITHHKYKSGLKNADHKVAKKTSHHFYDTMLQYYDKHYQKRYPTWVRHLVKMFINIKKGDV
jgi:GT2 family glycosyltransferase